MTVPPADTRRTSPPVSTSVPPESVIDIFPLVVVTRPTLSFPARSVVITEEAEVVMSLPSFSISTDPGPAPAILKDVTASADPEFCMAASFPEAVTSIWLTLVSRYDRAATRTWFALSRSPIFPPPAFSTRTEAVTSGVPAPARIAPALVTVIWFPAAVTPFNVRSPDVVVISTISPVPPAVTVFTVRAALSLVMVIVPSPVVAIVTSRACPPVWSNWILPVPVVRLAAVTPAIATLSRSTAPFVVSAEIVVPCTSRAPNPPVPIPDTAFRSRVAPVNSRATSVSAFSMVPAELTVTRSAAVT